MTKRKTPDPVLIAMTVAIGVAAAGGAYAALSVLSRPSHLQSRMSAIEAGIERTHAVLRRPRDTSHYLEDPICRASPPLAGELLRGQLNTAAQQSGLASPGIVLVSPNQDLTSQTFPVMFTLDVTGRYDLVLGFLNRLAQSEPEVFADSLDLTSRTSAVSLKLTGRIECQTSS